MNFYSKVAVMLGRVCSRWFIVSRGDPLLWTLVDLTFPTASDLASTKLCLRYSAGLPLALQIYHPIPVYSDDAEEKDDEAIIVRLMEIVASNAHRWGEISLHLKTSKETLDPLLSVPPGSFNSLRSVVIEMSRLPLSRKGHVARLYQSFYRSPLLRAINWWADPHMLMGVDGAPLQQLTHVGVQIREEPREIFILLRSCPQLQALCARVSLTYPEDYEGSLAHPPLPLSHLQILMLGGSVYHTWKWLLDCLIVPRLDRLDMSPVDAPGLKAVETMLRRSAAQPRMLTLMSQPHGHLTDTIVLLRSRPMERLRIFRYVPYVDEFLGRPNGESFSEVARYLPPHIRVFTTKYSEAENAYLQMSQM